ncbi:hypothetical protein [Streptomyces sp. NPDC059071]|uniref:hypothetical protein n=1 Tax=unclassified Streptomyces TaxID=2593676 RepID=UPI00365FCE7C
MSASRIAGALTAVFAVTLALLTLDAPSARADWAHDPCSYATLDQKVISFTEITEAKPPNVKRSVGRWDAPDSLHFTQNVTEQANASVTYGGEVGFDLGKVISIGLEAGYSLSEGGQYSIVEDKTFTTAPGQFKWVAPIVIWDRVIVARFWYTPGGRTCAASRTEALFPRGLSICAWSYDSYSGDYGNFERECSVPRNRIGDRGAGGAPGASPGTPAGPQPVTSVYGLPEGTVLATTDTQRIYKIVGGAPVWQATCADEICLPQPRPTTQSVIDGGPATPRNGSSAVDQEGHVYLFVGGAPVWQDSCDAPVNCGTPVKVSNWSIGARDHMNDRPADGHLVQARAGSVNLPVAGTVGGALMPFADPQEVIDTGYGSDWTSKVTVISANSYNLLGFNPAEGTLVQGTGGGSSTPVAQVIGNALVPFGSEQEVLDVGIGSDWRTKVRAIPTRVFEARSRVPMDGTLLQGAGGAPTPVAAIVGGGRVDFASPQEVIDSGYGADWGAKVRIIPARAFNELVTEIGDGTRLGKSGTTGEAAVVGGARVDFHSETERNDAGYGPRPLQKVPARVWDAMTTRIADGTRIAKSGTTGEAAVVGGARVDFHSETERNDAGYGTKPRQVIPARVWDAMTTQIADGTRIAKSGTTGEAAVVGGARVDFHSETERNDAGYGTKPRQVVPARVWDAMTTQIADGTRIAKSGTTGEAAVMGGARVDFHSEAERNDAGYGTKPRQVIPARVWDGMTTRIADGTRIAKSGTTGEAAVVGGARVDFHSMEELQGAGYGTRPRQVIPARVWDAMTTQIADGTRIAKSGSTGEAAVVGGARVDFHSEAERNDAGYGAKPRQVIPARVWDGMTTRIADGTLIKAPGSADVWRVSADRRQLVSGIGATVWTVPQRVIDAIPVG